MGTVVAAGSVVTVGGDVADETLRGWFPVGPQAAMTPLLGAKLAQGSVELPGATRFASSGPAFGPGAQVRRAQPVPR